MKSNKLERVDYQFILDVITPNANVLDLGCGDGLLLELLAHRKEVKGLGLEIEDSCIHSCMEKGLSVLHMDLDTGLVDFPDKSFDYVILNQTLQQLKEPHKVLEEGMRVGHHIIVGFPNFCHISARCSIFFTGRVPITRSLPYNWYDTPNLHFLSILDFEIYCQRKGFRIENSFFYSENSPVGVFPNLLARDAIFVLSR